MQTARRLRPPSRRQQQSKDNAVGGGRNAREQMGLGEEREDVHSR